MPPIYLIPFDNKYFLLGISLIHNFKSLLMNRSSIHVMDFGLTSNQVDFLKELGVNVLKTPTHLIGAHPYTLKANLISFLTENDLTNRYIIFMDADMILLKNPEAELKQIIQSMQAANKEIAVCQDMGSTESIGKFISAHRPKCLTFAQLASEQYYSKPYLNIGFVIFAPTFDFLRFKNLSDQMEGEVCWEQNAINLMCAENEPILFPLDSRLWNVHANLLSSYTSNDSPFIIHITSTNGLVQGMLDICVGQVKFEFFYRYFKNQHIMNHQENTLKYLTEESGHLFLKYLQGTPA